jgi:hypothetical protein
MKSFSNGNGPAASNGAQDSPATVTITGVHLGAGDTHWAKQV